MARIAAADDFLVEVEGVGTFCFARRTMRDELKIQVEYSRIVDGVKPTEWLHLVASWIAALKVMTVRAPEGWDVEAMDPLDDQTFENLAKVHRALFEKEQSFRRSTGKDGQAAGQDQGDDRGVLVPA